MARPREFDEARVIGAARDAFWSAGIEATSISDLCTATGLSVGSIYKAFESKSGLFHATLDDYLSTIREQLETLLARHGPGLDGLQAWLDAMIARIAQAGEDGPLGCYAVVCTAEVATTDEEARRLLQAHERWLLTRLGRLIADGVTRGELTADPDAGARLLLMAINGAQLQARTGLPAEAATDSLTLALQALR